MDTPLEHWWIDGYNLLHGTKSNPMISREMLFGWIADFASQARRKVTMVLDGVGRDEEFMAYQTPNFQITYSQSVSADAAIERKLYEGKDEGRMNVVTNDRAIAHMARGSGARVYSTKDFLEILRSEKKDSEDIRFKQIAKAHGFHRPFQDKLKNFDS